MNRDSEPRQKIFKLRALSTHGLSRKLFSLVQSPLKKILLLDQPNRVYTQVTRRKDRSLFLDRVLEALDISYDIAESDLLSVPQQDPVAVVANHPFGGIEGIILASMIRRVRPDFKLLANHLLRCIPDLHDLLIYIDPFDKKDSILTNLKPLREAIAWLREGHVLAVFPAGARASLRALSVKKRDLRLASGLPSGIEELSALISDIEAHRKGVPVLLRQYVKLGGKLMAFTVDPSFGNGLDGLLLVDLRKGDRKIRERYLGEDASATFLSYHEGQPTRDLVS